MPSLAHPARRFRTPGSTFSTRRGKREQTGPPRPPYVDSERRSAHSLSFRLNRRYSRRDLRLALAKRRPMQAVASASATTLPQGEHHRRTPSSIPPPSPHQNSSSASAPGGPAVRLPPVSIPREDFLPVSVSLEALSHSKFAARLTFSLAARFPSLTQNGDNPSTLIHSCTPSLRPQTLPTCAAPRSTILLRTSTAGTTA